MSAFRNIPRNFHRFLPKPQARLPLNRGTCIGHRSLATGASLTRNVQLYRPIALLSAHRAQWAWQTSRLISTHHVLFNDELKTVSAPAFAESVTEGDISWEKSVGDTVSEDEVIAEIETDKTAIPVPSPVAGVLAEILIENEGRVLAGDDLCRIRVSGDATSVPVSKEEVQTTPTEAPTPSSEVQTPPTSTPSSTSGPIPTTPPPIPPIPGGPIGVEPTPPPPPPSPPTPSQQQQPSQSVLGTRNENRVKMTRMRQRIAQRLKEAQNVNAMLTTFNEVDMSSLIEMRKKYQDGFVKKHGIKLGFVSPFVKAACFALQDQPVVNAVIEENEIVYRDYIDISIAVATPKGLVVPVVRNVETMDYAMIEKNIHTLGEKARNGQLAIEDMDGGTFTVSNGGVFGSMFGTPIINPPQSAILGMHGVFDRPVAINGKVEIRPMMYIALTYDHRLIDGREAVLFLRKIKSAVEDPRVLLLDV